MAEGELQRLTGFKQRKKAQQGEGTEGESGTTTNLKSSEVRWKVGNSAPTTLNWTERGVVTSVKDQGSCGSCWAFGCAATAESVLLLNGETNPDLSEQFLVSCTIDSSCAGTYYVEHVMRQALQGIPTEIQFPYEPFNPHPGICEAEGVTVSDQELFYYGKAEEEIVELLQEGPMVVTISATGWSSYTGGVFRCQPSDQLNHVVQLVGYDAESWLLKNQWGTRWGEDGYIRLSRDPFYNCQLGAELFTFVRRHCLVPGCSICASGDINTCTTCKDPAATLTNGQCICPSGKVLTAEGLCVACRVLGCTACNTANPD